MQLAGLYKLILLVTVEHVSLLAVMGLIMHLVICTEC